MKEISRCYQKQSLFVEFGFGIFCIIMAMYNWFFSTPYYVFLSCLGLLLTFVPRIIEKVLRLKQDDTLRLAIHLYIVLTYGIGMIFNGYSRLYLYDKLMHTLTGAVFALGGLIAFYLLKPRRAGKRKVEAGEFWQAAIFTTGIAALVAIIWETVEYVINLVLHNDPQHVLTTGVTDTMMDMIVCLVGAVLFWIPMYQYYRRGRKGILMGVFDSFYQTNLSD